MRYPPAGVRGVAFSNRAGGYGSNFRPYMAGSTRCHHRPDRIAGGG